MKHTAQWTAGLMDTLLRVLYPPLCMVCRAPGHDDLDICAPCRCELPWFTRGCRLCARVLPEGAGPVCGACLRRPPPFDATRAAFHYGPPLDRLVAAFKYRGRLAQGRLLAQLWTEALSAPTPLPDLILPVPLHPRRLRERGFNQALELARPLARTLDIPLAPALIRRVVPTPPQQTLRGRERRRNVRHAFEIAPVLAAHPPRSVALVDDVMTTGSTVDEIARVLKRAGVERVEVWVLARA
ncbi:amidophosphoribosyltransferase [Thioalkalivibrio denitrificans]|uniref:Amidophosphoribosyltransferase n=1 Tax=Thioalkalivibrio denitrificans TaxID=108003 RepID=A0A1V3NSK9_9GAMM|nr:amidophosphoribosyltransferase [Thioalkalivibrio denitrificans]